MTLKTQTPSLTCEDVNGFDDDAERCIEDAVVIQRVSVVLDRPDIPDVEPLVSAHTNYTARCAMHAREFEGMCKRMYPGRAVERTSLTTLTVD
jgi:hypothetical protein